MLDLGLQRSIALTKRWLAVADYNTVWCLTRIGGVPQEISFWDVTRDDAVHLPAGPPQRAAQGRGRAHGPRAVSTGDGKPGHDGGDLYPRPGRRLQATLLSLQQQTDSMFQVVVVDNAPSSTESAEVVKRLGLARCEYVVEPRPAFPALGTAGWGSSVPNSSPGWMTTRFPMPTGCEG